MVFLELSSFVSATIVLFLFSIEQNPGAGLFCLLGRRELNYGSMLST